MAMMCPLEHFFLTNITPCFDGNIVKHFAEAAIASNTSDYLKNNDIV